MRLSDSGNHSTTELHYTSAYVHIETRRERMLRFANQCADAAAVAGCRGLTTVASDYAEIVEPKPEPPEISTSGTVDASRISSAGWSYTNNTAP
jgi:hypothetical protein